MHYTRTRPIRFLNLFDLRPTTKKNITVEVKNKNTKNSRNNLRREAKKKKLTWEELIGEEEDLGISRGRGGERRRRRKGALKLFIKSKMVGFNTSSL